jgi:cytochrome bd ubiquinol oxidase subunit II
VTMFETLSLLALQQYWWVIISLLGSLLVFLMFVQGGQTLLNTIGTNEEEKTMLINSLGRKWELTFTMLVTFGGAMFAAFPKFYSVSFGGAYWVWITILFCFTIQAISYEFRHKKGNFWGARVYEAFLYINGSLGVFLIGVAVGTFFTGSKFLVDVDNHVIWQGPLRGLEAVFSIQNVLLGFAVFFLARLLASMYFINNISDENIYSRAKQMVRFNAVPFLAIFIAFVVMLLLKRGFTYDPVTKEIQLVPFQYLHNFVEMPWVLAIFLAGVVLVISGIFVSWFKTSKKGIWFTGLGTVLAVMALFLVTGFNHTSFYPSVSDLQSSLTIENSSSSHYTLTVMSYVSLFVPVVIAYIYKVWRSLDRKKIDKAEMQDNEHIY